VKRIAVLAVVLLLGFYVGWPAWSGYRIKEALQSKDAAMLASKIDFDRVRDSMRPTVTQKVSDGFDRYQGQLGATAGVILGQLKTDAVPRIVEASLKALLTPDTIIRLASEGGPLKENLEKILREQVGRGLPAGGAGPDSGTARPGGNAFGNILGQVLNRNAGAAPVPPTDTTTPVEATPKRSFSMSNVKSFSFAGPLSFRVGVAKDVTTTDADVTAEMSFTGGDWKITGLVPRP
jgi:Protein of unknown function (DUF2939)